MREDRDEESLREGLREKRTIRKWNWKSWREWERFPHYANNVGRQPEGEQRLNQRLSLSDTHIHKHTHAPALPYMLISLLAYWCMWMQLLSMPVFVELHARGCMSWMIKDPILLVLITGRSDHSSLQLLTSLLSHCWYVTQKNKESQKEIEEN